MWLVVSAKYIIIMFDLILIPHKEVSFNQLVEIIKIKSKAWPYNFKSQLAWINANLKDSDIHVLLSLNEKRIAYLNLIEIKIKIDGGLQDGYGIGNVCAKEKAKGWGKEIMAQTNLFLKQRNKIGLLFCKDSLVNFYRLNSWNLIEKEKLTLLFNIESIEVMIFNLSSDFKNLEYLGKVF